MSRINVKQLCPRFLEKFERLKEDLKQEDIDVLFYCGFRSCADQAKIWRSSRSTSTINAKLRQLEKDGFDFLAKVIADVGPQYGSAGTHRTHAIPGYSMHNYGKAVDGVVMVMGKPDWDMDYWHLWEKYGSIAMRIGLTWAGSWTNLREYVHVESGTISVLSPDGMRAMLENAGSL